MIDVRLFWSVFVSAFGSGLIFPYTSLYLLDVTGTGKIGVSLYYSALGLTSIISTLAITFKTKSLGDTLVGEIGALCSGLAFAMLALVLSVWYVVPAGMLSGVGLSFTGTALTSIIVRHSAPSDVRRNSARRYWAMNTGIGLGVLVGGIAVAFEGATVLRALMFVNALSYAALFVQFRLLRGAAMTELSTDQPNPASEARSTLGFRALLSTLPVLAYETLVRLCVIAQFEATLPVLVSQQEPKESYLTPLAFGVNTMIITLAQGAVSRLTAGLADRVNLFLSGTAWAGGFALVSIVSLSGLPAWLGLSLGSILIGLGECIYSAAVGGWLADVAPRRALTQLSALLACLSRLGTAVGPALGVFVVVAAGPKTSWLLLSVLSAVTFVPLVKAPTKRLSKSAGSSDG